MTPTTTAQRDDADAEDTLTLKGRTVTLKKDKAKAEYVILSVRGDHYLCYSAHGRVPTTLAREACALVPMTPAQRRGREAAMAALARKEARRHDRR